MQYLQNLIQLSVCNRERLYSLTMVNCKAIVFIFHKTYL